MVTQQKRALYGLIIGVVWAITVSVVFITQGGVTRYAEDAAMRGVVVALFLAGIVAYLIMLFFTRGKPGKVTMDERDRMIMSQVPRVQFAAVMISLVVWAIALTEVYWDEGQIPVIFPYIILLATTIVNVLAICAGVLIGYRRAR